MKYYRALMRGENFLLRMEGRKDLYGFYTNRYVEASDSSEAELIAIQAIRNDSKLIQGVVLNKPWFEKKPMIYLDELYEIEEADMENHGGFSFYLMSGSD